MRIEHNQKFTIEGEQFTAKDLQAEGYGRFGVGSSDRWYGSKRTIMLTADGKGDRQSWEGAVELKHGQRVWLDGEDFRVVLLNKNASDGVRFISSRIFETIERKAV